MSVRATLTISITTALILVLAPVHSGAQVASACGGTGGGDSKVTESGPYEIGQTEAVELESELDGGIIQIGVVRPDVPEGTRVPVIVDAGSYFYADLMDADLPTCNPFLIENFVQHGYAVAFIPTRGAGGTDRCSDLMGDRERGDLSQAVTWLGEQEWSNGNVGMTGISYHGSTPWEVASLGNPHLKTIVPASGVIDMYSQNYRSGRADSRWWLFVPGYQWYYNTAFTNPSSGRDPLRWGGAAVCETAIEGMAATVESYVTGEDDSFDYWKDRNSKPGTEKKYRGSVFLVGGWDDHNVTISQAVPWINELKRKRVYVKMLLGQWPHAWPDSGGNAEGTLRWDYADTLLGWFDHWLKGEAGELGPPVEVQDNTGSWRTEESWPPKHADHTKLYLTSTGSLGAPGKEPTQSTTLTPGLRSRYVYVTDNPQSSETPADPYCAGCATFSTDPQTEDLKIAGIPSVDITVIPHGPGGSVTAYMYSADESEPWELLGYGGVDLRFPKSGHKARTVTPGKEMKIELDFEPLDAVVQKGKRLVLVFDQGNKNDMAGPLGLFPVDLVYGAKTSSFTFPVVTPDASTYFKPPAAP